ncbi:hypothetical protein ACFL6M_02180 [Candidatus Eisenbacteria bacterium]|uniref:Uncharacterized protein n=1 Tax=Eiseniibacteriota bacterium TaxID=2212470 RepID=A0ABV6YJ98_UNCEI
MKRVLLALALIGVAFGGANAQVTDLTGGVFIAHYVPEITNSEPPDGWCGQYDVLYAIADHSEQNNRIDTATYQWSAWYVLSGFCEDKQFCGCQFGVGQIPPYIWGFDTGSTQACWPPVAAPSGLELPSGGWPGAGEGTALTSTSGPWDGNYLAVYLMTGYAYGYGYSGIVPLDVNGQTGSGGWTNCEGVPVEFMPAAYGGMGINTDGTYVQPECGGPPPGACCFPDGTCLVIPQMDCVDPGVWYGGPCDPNPCPPPTGACCFEDGSCLEMIEGDCFAAGGILWLGPLTTCNPNPCPPPLGACCFEDGSCLVLPEGDCFAAGGTLWIPFGVCSPNPCPPPPDPSVCCVGSDCFIVYSESECIGMGGDWYPDDTTCDPNPCPPTPADSPSWGSIKALYR